MIERAGVNGLAIAAGWRVLLRPLRYARGNPRKLWWIARRAWQIVRGGQLRGVLQRHRTVEDFYRDYPAWVKTADRLAEGRVARLARQAAQGPVRPRVSGLLPVYC